MDISEIELAEKVDVIFSNAVLHWILNHKKYLNASGKF